MRPHGKQWQGERVRDDANCSFGIDRRAVLGGAAALAASRFATVAGLGGAESIAAATEGAEAVSPAFELEEATIAELQAGLSSRRWTSERLAVLYVDRIDAIDRRAGGPNAIAETNPDLLAQAAELDRERKAGRLRGPLHGVPIVLKDNIETGDRMKTSAGSMALAESVAERDAFLVGRLRDAGALILGKTNLSEWANFRSTKSTSGWSGRGGQVRNPYALDRNPCGSSSGSGAAASANLCAAAVGTETDGSIICPAAFNGLVGIKPTLGMVSRSGVIPIAHSQDTPGPMARTVADAAYLLAAMAGVDLRDAATAASAGKWDGRVEPLLAAGGLRGARLGVARSFFGWHPEIDRQMATVLDTLRGLGAELVDPIEIPHKGEYDDSEFEVLLYEFKHDLNLYLGDLPERGQPRSLAALIEFNSAHASREMPWFGQEIFEKAEAKGPLSDEAYLSALEKNLRLTRAEGIDAVIAAHRLDALVCPSMSVAYLTDWVNGDAYGGSATSPCAVAGYPHLAVPAGFVHGLPWGLSLLGPAWSDARLIRYAHAFEQATQVRRPPQFLPTLPLG